MSQRPSPPRGMRDLLPAEVALRRDLLGRILHVYERFGFDQIETPAVEEIDRLVSSEGGENTTMVFKVLRRGIDPWPPATETDAVDLGLRYDLTVPLARFYATHSNALPNPFKSIQTGPVFRAERPQKGRYRQFTQCDIDILGDPSLHAETELVIATSEALRACDVGAFSIRVNDRRILETLVASAGFASEALGRVLIAMDKLDKIGLDGVRGELQQIDAGPPSEALTASLEKLQSAEGWDAIVNALPSAVDAEAIEGLAQMRDAVAAVAPWITLTLDVTLVRGMGYYTGQIFEVQHDEFKGSIGGGGRYDRMIGKLSGIDVPAAGFSIGFERLCHILEAKWTRDAGVQRTALLYPKEASLGDVAVAAAALREAGAVVRAEIAVKNRKAQLLRLTQGGFTHWVSLENNTVSDSQPLTADGSSSSNKDPQ